MSNIKVVDVIIRKTAEKTKFTGEGNLSVSISSPSVIEIQGSAQDVARYVRQGKDPPHLYERWQRYSLQ
ncbi:type 1 secretion target domain-containng protein [Enterobacter asburiae]|uniref:Type 1 secretion target domain-containng protein n=1 Tax=Enterobacter asburiae TaxID=61645 RepID=A0A376F9K5_ENTAS|nr:type 1 secretion target domain-containng protein [Enterobacter asburiae]